MAYPSFVLMSSVVYELRVRSVSKETYREPARRGCIINKENSSLNTNKDFFLYPQLVQISQVVACAKVTIYIYISLHITEVLKYLIESRLGNQSGRDFRRAGTHHWNSCCWKDVLKFHSVIWFLLHRNTQWAPFLLKLDVVKCWLTNCLCTECGIHSFLLVKLAVRIWI